MAVCEDRLEGEVPSSGCAAVVGAGIAGLSAAIALRRAGWHVEVFEKSQFKNETGAAITVTPNAAVVLDRWGLDREQAQAVPNLEQRIALAGNPAIVIKRDVYSDTTEEFGHGYWSFHRVDLHRSLGDLASHPARGHDMGPAVEIRLGREVTALEPEKGVFQFAGGYEVKKDLIILADGAHMRLLNYMPPQSRLISDFTGKPSNVQRTGRSIYRWLISTDNVKAAPDVWALFENELPGFAAWLDAKKNIYWITYCCRGGNVLNNAVVHDTQAGQNEDDPWNSPASRADVLALVEDFHPTLKRMVTMASEDGIKVHHLYKRPALSSFIHGRAAVVGDAAHVMMPTHAAGAGIAIESAASLEVLFRGVDGRDTSVVKQRLELFDKLRIPRCNLAMLASNAGPRWLRVPGLEAEIRKFYSGSLPPPGAQPYSKPFREVLFHHDEYHAAEQALAEVTSRENPDAE
ncbi:hypothetical protein VTK26DRAFT_2813 [Humicola hyalothermophila]